MMAEEHERPIVFVLSNPSSKVEAHPHDVVRWSDGRAIVAVGSPFEPLVHAGFTHRFSQVNNFYAFPGIGAGAWLSRARRISDGMLIAAAQAIHGSLTDEDFAQGLLLPASARLRSWRSTARWRSTGASGPRTSKPRWRTPGRCWAPAC